jgi:hypothetical protein
MTRKDENIYQDQHTGGWVCEVLALGDWVRLGIFGERRAAIRAAQTRRDTLSTLHYVSPYRRRKISEA